MTSILASVKWEYEQWYIMYICVVRLGEAGLNCGIVPNSGEYSVGVTVRALGAAVATLCVMITLITLYILVSINSNVTTEYERERQRERKSDVEKTMYCIVQCTILCGKCKCSTLVHTCACA